MLEIIRNKVSSWVDTAWDWVCTPRIHYTRRELKMAGYAFGPFIVIQERYRNDTGLLYHELTHVNQFRVFGLKMLKVFWDDEFRYRMEVLAYHVQAKHTQPHKLHILAEHLATRYGFDVTSTEAMRDICFPHRND